LCLVKKRRNLPVDEIEVGQEAKPKPELQMEEAIQQLMPLESDSCLETTDQDDHDDPRIFGKRLKTTWEGSDSDYRP
jgi:hypothetical protein